MAVFFAPLVLSLALVAGNTSAAINPPSRNVAWLPAAADVDIDRAFAQARAQNKPLLMYWGATWCPPCNQLKATFFNRQDFAQASRAFVAVHVDGDRPGAQKIGARFKVSGYPTVVLFTAGGAEITRLPGEADPEQMMAVLRQGMAGGRPAKAVLADARAGKPLSPAEWRLLAFYSWGTDEQQLTAPDELPGLLAQLAAAAPVSESEVSTRLWLKAVAESDDGKGLKPDGALRERVGRVFADPALSRTHADVVANEAPALVKALSDDDSAERAPLVTAASAALRRLEQDGTLSRGDRISALIGRIQLARLGQPKDAAKVDLPASLLTEVKTHIARDDREISDGYERQAVITAAAYAYGQAGLWDDSDALLKSNLAKSHSPYYLMSQLGSNARKRGLNDQALQWYGEAFAKSEGPATRLQWGSNYLVALVDLAPKDAARIERTAATLIREAGQDKGAFVGRSVRSLQRMGKKLVGWDAGGAQTAALQRLQKQLDGVCKKVEATERAACQGLLKPAA
jgi:thioredoxin-related protein